MALTIEEAVDWIHSRLPFGSRPGLERVNALLERVNHPEKKVPVIHIAGTNGKGSTVTYLRCMLEEAGLKVGSFTSPYVETFNERIAINGQPIADAALIAYVEAYQPLVAEMDQQEETAGITEFETLTAMALDFFWQEQVDVAVVEVGLGGLLDCTNVVEPVLTGITTIGLDHTDILGDTIADIAYQKAGIIKEGIPVVTGNILDEAMTVISEAAKSHHAPLYQYGEEYSVDYLHPDDQWGELFTFYGDAGKLTKLKISMLGIHQVENAGVAIQLFYLYCIQQGLPFQTREVVNGLKRAHWPGRMERLGQEPLIILDGAHNDHAMKRLVENMKHEFGDYRIDVLFSALSTKNVSGMLALLKTIPNSHIYVTTFDYPKAIELSSFGEFENDPQLTIVSMWEFGLGEILEKQSSDSLLLVTGSLYFISQVRSLLLALGGKHDAG